MIPPPSSRSTSEELHHKIPWSLLTQGTGLLAAGGVVIKIGDEVIGAAGVSGAPGGEKDEACVQAGIEKVADQLK